MQIATLSAENLGKFLFRKELLILDQEGEDLVIGAIWFNSVMTAQRREITKIVDIRRFGIPEEVPVEFSQDVAPEDKLLENSDLDAYPNQVSVTCTCHPEFPESERLNSIVKSHGSVLFHKEGLRVSSLKLKVHPSSNEAMSFYLEWNFKTTQGYA